MRGLPASRFTRRTSIMAQNSRPYWRKRGAKSVSSNAPPLRPYSRPQRTGALTRWSRPDLHRMAAQTIDGRKAVLIGGVVTYEHRSPAAERVLVHELEHRRALVLARGLNLDDPLAGLDAERPAVAGQQRAGQPVRIAREAWRSAAMQRQGASLVFE